MCRNSFGVYEQCWFIMVDMEEKITELNVSEEAVAETTAEVTEDVVVEMTEEEAAEVSENLEKL